MGSDNRVLHVAVRGRVQGVGFRWFVRERARALKLSGWVRNAADGSVEVLAEGEATALEELRALLGRGPTGANVAEVVVCADQPSTHPVLTPFAILR